jgi:transcription factor AP-4
MDKKLRRQIANCNERRRMQSINAGFHTLRVLMPHLQGEKLSKAAVLQHAAEHIYRLNQERERLVQQNTSLRVMLSKYWPNSDPNSVDGSQDGKVNKATSPLCFDDERAASRELEQIFATQKEVDRIKAELERERSRRISLEARLKDRSPSEEDDEEEDTESDTEEFKHKRPRVMDTTAPGTRNNLDIIVRAIRQIEGDAFSRSATPTCGSQERSTGTFTPISTGDNSRVSPITPVCAS